MTRAAERECAVLTLDTTAADPARAPRHDGPDESRPPLTRAEYRRLRAEREQRVTISAVPAGGAVPADAAGARRTGALRMDDPSTPWAVTPPTLRTEQAEQAHTEQPSVQDVFEAAARLFAATAETTVARIPETPAEQPASTPRTAMHRAVTPRRRAPRVTRQIAAGSLSLGAMTVVGLLAFSAMLPSPAIATAPAADVNAAANPVVKSEGDIQAFVTTAPASEESLDRPEVYGVVSMSDLAAESGVTRFASTWVNDTSSDVQWPFPVGVPISAGFGDAEYASQFGSTHKGTDFTPGGGAEIHAVAAGTVRIATESGDAYGVTVVIDHVIDGQAVSTRYGHMQYGSLQVAQGDVVQVGQVIGKVGSTGKSTGDHLHLEVLIGGTTPTDPVAWITQHTS